MLEHSVALPSWSAILTVAERRGWQRLKYSFNGHAKTQQLVVTAGQPIDLEPHRQTVARKPRGNAQRRRAECRTGKRIAGRRLQRSESGHRPRSAGAVPETAWSGKRSQRYSVAGTRPNIECPGRPLSTAPSPRPPATEDAHDHEKWHHGFYQTLERPDTKSPCCNFADCRPTSGRQVDGHYEVKVNGAWVSVPPDKILRQSAPDLGFHVCAPFKFNGRPDHLYCVVVPPEI